MTLESMTRLKQRARQWPGEWGERARALMYDAKMDLIWWPSLCREIQDDLRRALEECERQREGAGVNHAPIS